VKQSNQRWLKHFSGRFPSRSRTIQDSTILEWDDLRFHALEITGMIAENGLTFKFRYGAVVFHQATKGALAVLYGQNLQELIAACSTTIR